MERRKFLQRLALLIGGSLFTPEQLFSGKQHFPQKELWLSLVDYARWSPSPHNIQPWKLKVISETSAELHYSADRLFPVSDKDNRFTYIAMGIFIESLSVAASNYGYQLDFISNDARILEGPSSQKSLGNLVLSIENVTPDFDKELLKQRKTSRLHYQPFPVKDPLLYSLKKIAEQSDHTFEFTSDASRVEEILKLNRDALFIDLNEAPVRKELDTWLRYSNKEAETKKDGLWYHCMNFPGRLMRSFFHHPHLYNHGLIKKVIDKYYLNTMDGTKTIGWIKGKTETPSERIEAGRMLARFSLELTKNNAFMHPFGSVITNQSAHLRFSEIVNDPSEDTWFLMRLGYSNEPPRSYRLDAGELFI